MAEQGFGDLVAPPPLMCADAVMAGHCWRFCEGWRPERWPMYAALHDVDDWQLLIDLMQILKDAK